YRIAVSQTPRVSQGLKAFVPWGVLMVLLFAAGGGVVFQPMQVRGAVQMAGGGGGGSFVVDGLRVGVAARAGAPGGGGGVGLVREGRRSGFFGARTRLRAGGVDFSGRGKAAGGRAFPHLPVTVHAEPLDRPGQRVGGSATTEAATNKLFRAAQFDLP